MEEESLEVTRDSQFAKGLPKLIAADNRLDETNQYKYLAFSLNFSSNCDYNNR